MASLDAPGIRKLPQEGSQAVYAAGHVLFVHGVGAYARPFDAARVEFTGPEGLLAERADSSPRPTLAWCCIAQNTPRPPV